MPSPPDRASHCETPRWTFDLTSAGLTGFMGNWVDVWPKGDKDPPEVRGGDVQPVAACIQVNNLVVGRLWVDTLCEMRVNNLKTGASAVLTPARAARGPMGSVGRRARRRWRVHQAQGQGTTMTATKPDGSTGRILWAKNPEPKEGVI